MRPWIAVLLFASIAPAMVHAEPDTVAISEVLPDPEAEREFVELWNPTNQDVAMDGWTIEDAAGTQFTFPQWRLPPGGRVVVWGGGEPNGLGPAWNRATVWNNDGDAVVLRDASGTEIDRFAYGDAPDAMAEAPAKGQSLQLDNGWQHGEPTPGAAPGSQGGSVSFQVDNAPPELHAAGPATVRPGDVFVVDLHVMDPNGDDVSWRIQGPGLDLNGTESGDHAIEVTAPGNDGTVAWVIEASDGQTTAQVSVEVNVQSSALRVILPTGGIAFPPMVPGAQEVAALQPFLVRNDGNQTMAPRIDISPFRGAGEVPVDGNLRLLFDNGEAVTYHGPLTVLPSLGPGEQWNVTMALEAIPSPLPAGHYGTTFAVIE